MATATAYGTVQRSGWTITEGVILVIAGIFAIGAHLMTSAFTSFLLPVILLFEGVVLIVSAFRGRSLGSTLGHIALGIISLLAAAALFAEPIYAIASLPIILGIYLMVKGIAQLAVGASTEAEGKGWIYTSGILNIVLAIIIWAQPFGASVALTGFYIGISIFMLGVVLLMAPKAADDEYRVSSASMG